MSKPDPLASKREALVNALTAAGKPPPAHDVNGIIAHMTESVLDDLLLHYDRDNPAYIW